MPKTRKVQVTLQEDQYATLARIARRERKKLAAVVRESIEKYCIDFRSSSIDTSRFDGLN